MYSYTYIYIYIYSIQIYIYIYIDICTDPLFVTSTLRLPTARPARRPRAGQTDYL